MKKPTQDELDALAFTVEAIGRTGAKNFEVGYLDETPPYGWYATAHYEGAKVFCDEQPDPIAATMGLYAILAAGATCVKCERTVALNHKVGLIDSARMHNSQFMARPADPNGDYCVRGLDDKGWSGCGRQA